MAEPPLDRMLVDSPSTESVCRGGLHQVADLHLEPATPQSSWCTASNPASILGSMARRRQGSGSAAAKPGDATTKKGTASRPFRVTRDASGRFVKKSDKNDLPKGSSRNRSKSRTDRMPGFVGMLRSGRNDLSVRAKDIARGSGPETPR